MNNEHTVNSSMPSRYEVRFRGELDERRKTWFEGLTVRREGGGDTVVVGILPDQAAIHGVLERIRDLGLHLVSVGPAPSPEDTDRPETASGARDQETP